MKTSLKFLMVVMALVIIRCSEEKIEPAQLDEDPSTHMQSVYPSSVFAIEVTTIEGGRVEEDGTPQLTEFYLIGEGAKVSVNWGDGTIEKITLGESRNYMGHQYSRFKNYTIQITGEISRIKTFGMFYQHIVVRNVYLSGLVNLVELRMGLNNQGPSVINFSHNSNIELINIIDDNLTDVIIPSSNKLTGVALSGSTGLSTSVVDRIISRVYTSVQSSPRAGGFSLNASWYEESDEMVGPPSSYSITKLKKLRDVYGWSFTPNPE